MLHDETHMAGRNGLAVPQGTASLTPMLSVLLLLLAFFILLVSMVEFDTRRTQAALGSLNATFAARSLDQSPNASGAGETVEGAIRRLSVELGVHLETLLRSGSFAVETTGALAIVRIDNSELFASGLTPMPALDALASRVATLVATPPERLRYEIEVVEPFGEAGSTRRAGIVVRALEAAGVPPGDLMVSLASASPRQTRIEFHLLAPSEGADRQPRVPLR